MSCCLYWVILEERLSVRVLASAVDDESSTALARTNIELNTNKSFSVVVLRFMSLSLQFSFLSNL